MQGMIEKLDRLEIPWLVVYGCVDRISALSS